MNSLTSGEEQESSSLVARIWGQAKTKVVEMASMIKKTGKDDPRRIVHSVKVGLTLTLVSLLYYFTPLYKGFGESGMWAILTVVVVFEFTAGGTLSKSINRGCATLAAAALGLGTEYLSTLGGEQGGHAIVGTLVFILASAATFTRFFPRVRRKYDYGVMIFILTFTLVAVSGSRVARILELAHQRLSAILLGGATCILISIFVRPVWAGQDLHNIVAENIEILAVFLHGFGSELSSFANKVSRDKPLLMSYKSVFSSKAVEESLANFAWWEPPHGGFRSGYPWKQYLKIGILNRECASQIEALGRYIIKYPKYDLQVSMSPEFHLKFLKPCITMSEESSKALKEISSAMRNMRFPSAPALQTNIQNSKAAADDLRTNTTMLENLSLHKHYDLQEIMQLFLIASTLTDIIKCIEKISVSVNELARIACFQKPDSYTICDQETIKPCGSIDDRVMVHIHRSSSCDG